MLFYLKCIQKKKKTFKLDYSQHCHQNFYQDYDLDYSDDDKGLYLMEE